MGLKRIKLLINKILFYCIIDGYSRAKFLKKKHILASIGENCMYQSRNLPADPKMVKLHNNVIIAADVKLVTHDAIRHVFRYVDHLSYVQHLGAIEICDNVFVGTGAIILPNVCIHENCIISAGSVVTQDVPAGSIVAGVPAKVIGDFEALRRKRIAETKEFQQTNYINDEEFWWNMFYKERSMAE